MVKETSVIRLSSLMRNLYTIYPDLKNWNYKGLYKRDTDFEDEICKKRWLALRSREIEKTTQAIISFIDMNIEGNVGDSYLKLLIKYYIVLMDAKKYNLNYQMANDDIFEPEGYDLEGTLEEIEA